MKFLIFRVLKPKAENFEKVQNHTVRTRLLYRTFEGKNPDGI